MIGKLVGCDKKDSFILRRLRRDFHRFDNLEPHFNGKLGRDGNVGRHTLQGRISFIDSFAVYGNGLPGTQELLPSIAFCHIAVPRIGSFGACIGTLYTHLYICDSPNPQCFVPIQPQHPFYQSKASHFTHFSNSPVTTKSSQCTPKYTVESHVMVLVEYELLQGLKNVPPRRLVPYHNSL